MQAPVKPWRKWLMGTAAGVAVVAGGITYLLTADCEICLAQTVLLRGTVAENCAIVVEAYGDATSLPITTESPQRVNVGRVTQNCNKKIGYYLRVASTNCTASPTGAKVIDPTPDPDEYLVYSVEFVNPSGASPTGLLNTACDDTDNLGREVTNQKISGDVSQVWVNFTGSSTLGAGTYEDTLTITMTVKL